VGFLVGYCFLVGYHFLGAPFFGRQRASRPTTQKNGTSASMRFAEG
jgi:hypothetical protein